MGRQDVAWGLFGSATMTPEMGVARSGRIVKNCSRSKKNGSSRTPVKATRPGPGTNRALNAPAVGFAVSRLLTEPVAVGVIGPDTWTV